MWEACCVLWQRLAFSECRPPAPLSWGGRLGAPVCVTAGGPERPVGGCLGGSAGLPAGEDRLGRRIVTFSCCRMPPSHELNHRRLLE